MGADTGDARPPTRTAGRLQPLGQDYDEGHLRYVEKLDPAGRLWLRTKPFSAPPNEELARCLHMFGHLVGLLQLGVRAQVLDVGCGPGWLSEFLVRCGYWVTGVDISRGMIEVARQRIAALPGEVGPELGPLADFHALPVREMPWTSRFDAAVLYDTMHHFDDELETLRVIRRTLVPGGQLYIHEGVKPPPGSMAERRLIEEMERFGTLEAPFDPDYLVEVVEQAGFVDVRRLVEVDELVELPPETRRRGRMLERLLPGRGRLVAPGRKPLRPEFNIVHALNPFPSGGGCGADFSAAIEREGGWERDGSELTLDLKVTNTGRAFWPAALWFPYPKGSVTIGPYVAGAGGERRHELARVTLPQSVSPGETVVVEMRLRAEDVPEGTLVVDLVREGLLWFSEAGSQPLVLPPPSD